MPAATTAFSILTVRSNPAIPVSGIDVQMFNSASSPTTSGDESSLVVVSHIASALLDPQGCRAASGEASTCGADVAVAACVTVGGGPEGLDGTPSVGAAFGTDCAVEWRGPGVAACAAIGTGEFERPV